MVNEMVLTPSLCHFTTVVPSLEFFVAAHNFEVAALEQDLLQDS
jgi:hypothetical protein